MKISALLSLVPMVAAIGTRQPKSSEDPFRVVSARSGSPIHFLTLTASGSNFWLGGKSETYCPSSAGSYCASQTNDTIVFGGNNLDVVVPGGQSIYVAHSGALSFTTPHSSYVPAGSYQGSFSYTPGSSFGKWTFAGEGASGFMACPVSNSTLTSTRRRSSTPRWQVYVALQNATVPTKNVNDCLGFDALAVPINSSSTHAAWEYI
ncbi:hypothetical protein N7495_007763 [Penicillium taxi]|uniref:uncharacterized protein n=1 Tax=Penicillium taxi TaxID=168475 RepID=UPI0025457A8C|nr:uncharacterized protein N7495_007763 [Penicillium taxi]KAJ5887722.1 hypothetical protein N7495_007763 [Penicillium taxi]